MSSRFSEPGDGRQRSNDWVVGPTPPSEDTFHFALYGFAMRISARTFPIALAALGLAISACSSSEPVLAEETDEALSRQLRGPFAACLQLPIDTVETHVTPDRRIVAWEIQGNPAETAEQCLERLNIGPFEE